MIRMVGSLVLLFLGCSAIGQDVRGRIVEKYSGKPLDLASVFNTRTGIKVSADSNGNYNIQALPGDKLEFTCPAYHVSYLKAEDASVLHTIKMSKYEVALQEVEITSDMQKFKEDSILNHTLYRKQLEYAVSKSKRKLLLKTAEVGVSYDGLISEAALHLSGKKKRYRKFAAMLEANEQQAFIKARYTAGMVAHVTGQNDTQSREFILTHPITYTFARTASDLELKSWILKQYKQSKQP